MIKKYYLFTWICCNPLLSGYALPARAATALGSRGFDH